MTLCVPNFGEPFKLREAASNWRDKTSELGDVGLDLEQAYSVLASQAWSGEAYNAFSRWIGQIKSISEEFDKAAGDAQAAMQDFASNVFEADIAIITFAGAVAALMIALLPFMVPAAESAPAIATAGVAFAGATVVFGAAMLVLCFNGATQTGNVKFAIDELKQKVMKDGKREQGDALSGNQAVIVVPPPERWTTYAAKD